MEPAVPVKPGYATTEFWLSLLAIVIGAIQPVIADTENVPAAIVAGLTVFGAALAALGYSHSRGQAKKLPNEASSTNVTEEHLETIADMVVSKIKNTSMSVLLIAVLVCSLFAVPGYCQDGVTNRPSTLTTQWPKAGEPGKVVLIDEKGQTVTKVATAEDRPKAAPSAKGDATAKAEAPSKGILRRELTLRQRSRLGLSQGNLVKALKELKDEGEIDEETSYAEMAPMVFAKASKSSGAESFKAVGVDLETIFAWLEKIMPFLLMLAELFGEQASLVLQHVVQLC